ncbi:MAG: hypothetical protein ABUR63_08190, partial [Verrucomicrobiota bacterium]
RPQATPTAATRPVYAAATVVDAARAAKLAAMTRVPPGAAREVTPAEQPAAEAVAPAAGGFGRWVRKLAFRTFLVALVLAGAGYFARPHLPPAVTAPIEEWLHTVSRKVSAALLLLLFG